MKNHAARQEKNDSGDDIIRPYQSALPEAAVFLLTGISIIFFGLVVLYSTSYAAVGLSLFYKQMMWMLIGTAAFAATVLIGYRTLSNAGILLTFFCAALLVAALFYKSIKGAHRWIILGPISIQPSEFFKVVLVLFMAWFLSRKTRDIENASVLKVFLPAAVWMGPVIALVMAGKDLGTTTLLTGVFLLMLFAAGVSLKCLLPLAVGFPVAAFFLIRSFSPVRWARLTSFMDPELYQQTQGYQLWNSFLALGSGNWFGVGFTESRLKQKYLPEAHTDFILSIVGEELGYIAILAVIVAYIVLVFTGIQIGCKARTRQGMLTAFGMSSFIGMQAIINIGVICGAFPTKGMPAPLISYGGSSLVACMLAMGCVFSVALDNYYPGYAENLRAGFRRFFSSGSGKK